MKGDLIIKSEFKMPVPFDPIAPFPGNKPINTLMFMCKRQVVQCSLFVLARGGKQPTSHPQGARYINHGASTNGIMGSPEK